MTHLFVFSCFLLLLFSHFKHCSWNNNNNVLFYVLFFQIEAHSPLERRQGIKNTNHNKLKKRRPWTLHKVSVSQIQTAQLTKRFEHRQKDEVCGDIHWCCGQPVPGGLVVGRFQRVVLTAVHSGCGLVILCLNQLAQACVQGLCCILHPAHS